MVFGVFCCHLAKLKQKSEKLSHFYINISVGSQHYKRVLLFPYQNSLVAKFVYTFFFSFLPFFFFTLLKNSSRPDLTSHCDTQVVGSVLWIVATFSYIAKLLKKNMGHG
jgi:hypothetical protein